MKKAILVAVVYIIIFAMEILAYYITQADVIFIYGILTLVAFLVKKKPTSYRWFSSNVLWLNLVYDYFFYDRLIVVC